MKNKSTPFFFQINLLSIKKLLFNFFVTFLTLYVQDAKAQHNDFNELNETSHAEWEINNALFQSSNGENKQDWPIQVIQTTDGGYVVVGYTHGNSDKNNIITKYGSRGNKVWEYQFGCGGSLIDVTETATNYVAVGYSDCSSVGILFKITKNGNPSNAKVFLLANSDLKCVKPEPSGNGVIVCGHATGTSNSNLILFCMAESAISTAATSISSTTPTTYSTSLFLWNTNIGNGLPTSTQTNLGFPVVTTARSGSSSSTSEPWPEIPTASGGPSTPSVSSYDGFAGEWFTIDIGSSGYTVYVTGAAHWGHFSSPSSYTIPRIGGGSNTGNVYFDSYDVLAASFTPPSTPTTTPILNNWVKFYRESVNDATNATDYTKAISNLSPRGALPTTPITPTDYVNAIKFFNNTLENSGSFIDVVQNNSSNLVVGATYNSFYYQGINGSAVFNTTLAFNNEEYKDADVGALLISKSTGNPVNSSSYVDYICHLSGDDFKLRMVQNRVGNLYMVGSTGDTRMGWYGITPLERVHSATTTTHTQSAEDFLIGELNPDYASGTHVHVNWVRDVLTTGDPTRSAVGGICGFGIGLTKDDGFIISGNNDQTSSCGGGEYADDDMCMVKFSPDCHSNLHYTSGFEPYQLAKHYTTTQTISTSLITGRQLVVDAGVTLTISGCSIQFANSAWIYDQWDLNNNYTDANPEHGGFIGIKVMEGGHLILRNCTLSGIEEDCSTSELGGNMWDGVILESDPTTPQAASYTDKGWLSMYEVTITHARYALTTDGRSYSTSVTDNPQVTYVPTTDFDYSKWIFKHPFYNAYEGKGGALMTVDDSHFIDNEKDIEFMPFDRYKNRSVFSNTEFINVDHIPLLIDIDEDWEWLSSKDHVTIWENHGVQFKGCDFSGIDYASNVIHKRSRGIYSLESEFMVYPLCTSLDIPCSVLKRSRFETLSAAISASPVSNSVAQPLVIVQADFGVDNTGKESSPNMQNIYVSGTADAGTYINSNRIAVSNVVNDGQECYPYGTCGTYHPYPFGIDIEGTESYMFEENKIFGVGDGEVSLNHNFGIVVNNTWNYDNTVYLNDFDNLQHSAVSLAYNWNDPQSGGLFWQCNSFESASLDGIEVLSQYGRSYPPYTITDAPNANHKYYQGLVISGHDEYAANNRFYMSCASSSDNKLFADNSAGYISYNDMPTSPQIYEYAYNSNAIFDPSGCITTGIILNPTSNSAQFDEVCPSLLPDTYEHGGGGEDDWMGRMQNSQAHKEIIEGLIANGDDEQLMNYINDASVSSALLKQYLDQTGPYLSDRILKAAVERANNPLTNGDLADVTIDNSPLSDSVYDVLDSARPIVGGNYFVVQAQYAHLSTREKMKAEKSQYESEMKKSYKHGLLNYLCKDSIAYIDSAALLALAGGYTIEAVPFLIAQGNTNLASSILNNYNAVTQVDQDKKAMLLIALDNAVNNVSMGQAVANNLSALQAIATHNTPSSAQAKTLLYIYNSELEPVPNRPTYTSNSSNKTQTNIKKRQYIITNYSRFINENNVKLYPNPAQDKLNVELKLKDGIKKVTLIAYNIVGQMVYELQIPTDRQSYVIDIRTWIAGQYSIKIIADEELISTQKISIIK